VQAVEGLVRAWVSACHAHRVHALPAGVQAESGLTSHQPPPVNGRSAPGRGALL
jgi:hypothetical protein